MSNSMIVSGFVAVFAASSALAFNPINNQVTDRATLGVGTTLVPFNVEALPYLNGTVTGNSYSQTFIGQSNNYSGRLTVEVFGNVADASPALNDVLMIYTFTGDGAPAVRANGAEDFEFGVNSSVEIDYTALITATHGKIGGESFFDPAHGVQLDPVVSVNNNISSNDTFKFNYNPNSGTGRLVELGGNSTSSPGQTETFSWYVRSSGDVALNFVDVRIANFGFVTIQSLSLVNNPNQPDLNVPAPGVAGLLIGVAGLAGRRRR